MTAPLTLIDRREDAQQNAAGRDVRMREYIHLSRHAFVDIFQSDILLAGKNDRAGRPNDDERFKPGPIFLAR